MIFAPESLSMAPEKNTKTHLNYPSVGVALYIHFPYCLKKCPYCDFNSHLLSDSTLISTITEGIITELQIHAQAAYSNNITINTIFFGGGTPSLLPPIEIKRILRAIDGLFSIKPDAEITLEANPSSIEGGNILSEFAANGINRLSLGVQAFNDADLNFLGRIHNCQDAKNIIKILPNFFNRWSLDFIYARPNQTWQTWLAELEEILSYQPEHLSLYQLTIEPGTEFARLTQPPTNKNLSKNSIWHPQWTPLDNDTAAELFINTREYMASRGMLAYEISNFAKTAKDQSQHNLTYWEYGQWLGVGAGAHSRMDVITPNGDLLKLGMQNIKQPNKWIAAVSDTACTKKNLEKKIIFQSQKLIKAEEMVIEKLMMGLRLTSGIILTTAEKALLQKIHSDANNAEDFDQLWSDLVKHGLAQPFDKNNVNYQYPQKYALTEAGFLKQQAILQFLLPI